MISGLTAHRAQIHFVSRSVRVVFPLARLSFWQTSVHWVVNRWLTARVTALDTRPRLSKRSTIESIRSNGCVNCKVAFELIHHVNRSYFKSRWLHVIFFPGRIKDWIAHKRDQSSLRRAINWYNYLKNKIWLNKFTQIYNLDMQMLQRNNWCLCCLRATHSNPHIRNTGWLDGLREFMVSSSDEEETYSRLFHLHEQFTPKAAL